MKSEPPVILFKTWLTLARSSEESEVKEHAMSMINKAFHDHKAVEEYMKKNNIK
jgi:hypothetical protein